MTSRDSQLLPELLTRPKRASGKLMIGQRNGTIGNITPDFKKASCIRSIFDSNKMHPIYYS